MKVFVVTDQEGRVVGVYKTIISAIGDISYNMAVEYRGVLQLGKLKLYSDLNDKWFMAESFELGELKSI